MSDCSALPGETEQVVTTEAGEHLRERLVGYGLIGRVARNSLWNGGGFIYTVLFSLITIRLYVVRLDPDAFGLLMLLRIIITPLSVLDFGSTPATVKYIAESEGRGDREQTGRYLHTSLFFSLIVGGIGALLLVISAGTLVTRVFSIPFAMQDVARVCVYWIAARWFILEATSTFNSVPTALQRYDLANIGNIIANTTIAVGGLIALYRGGTLFDLMYSETVIAALMTFGWIFMVRRLLPGVALFPKWDSAAFRHVFRFGLWQMIYSVGGLLSHEAERFILGWLISAAAVGFYSVAWNLASRVYAVAYSLGQVLFPMVSTLTGQDRRRESHRIVFLASWLLTALSICLLVPLVVLARDVLLIWLGPVYAANSFTLLRLISVSAVVTSAFIVPSFFLLGVGETKWLALMSTIQGTITIAFSLILIPRFGLNGAAWGVAVATVAHIMTIILMWTRFFKEDICRAVYFSNSFANTVVGIVFAVVLSVARDTLGGQLGLIPLGLAAVGLSVLTLAAIILTSSMLPGWFDRHELLVALFERANRVLRRIANLESRDVETRLP
jgi:O-antigen/teichoic acid export membrane protein